MGVFHFLKHPAPHPLTVEEKIPMLGGAIQLHYKIKIEVGVYKNYTVLALSLPYRQKPTIKHLQVL
jgi:hypothetical protein